jgi:hypothetical protein
LWKRAAETGDIPAARYARLHRDALRKREVNQQSQRKLLTPIGSWRPNMASTGFDESRILLLLSTQSWLPVSTKVRLS